MNKNKLLSLFIKSLESPTNINGLLLYPQVSDDNITWELKNPNDLSYAPNVVEGYLEELFYDFMVMTGTKDRPEWGDGYTKYCRLNNNYKVYINKSLRNDINKVSEKLKTINLEDGTELESECYVKNWDITYQDNEALYIYVSLELFNPKINGEEVDDDTLESFIQDFTYNDTAPDQETDIIWSIATVIMDDKNLFDNDYMFVTPVIGYFDQFGNGLT